MKAHSKNPVDPLDDKIKFWWGVCVKSHRKSDMSGIKLNQYHDASGNLSICGGKWKNYDDHLHNIIETEKQKQNK